MTWKIGLAIAATIMIVFVYAICKIAAESDRRMRELFRGYQDTFKHKDAGREQ